MVGHGQHDLVHREFEFFSRALDDANIGLVRHQPVEVAVMQTRFGENGTRRLLQNANGQLENTLTIHFQHRVAEHLPTVDMTWDTQQAHMLAIRMNVGGQNARHV